ncbi:MAG TPA: substrate-binding domain-containing protein, partial [Opitutales bacterium]|nr:substrate-binding domain-containing protein [Opitutales bacterium]
MKNEPKLIAVAYDLNFRHAAEIFSGASDYLQKQGLDWRLLPLNFGFEAKLMELAASGRLSGAIGTFVSDAWIRGLSAHQVAAVNLFHFSLIKTVPSIKLDDEAIGHVAAKHLLDQGARTLAFVSQDEAYFNKTRRRSFAETCPQHRFHSVDSMALRKVQAESLKDLEKPVGVLCSNDRIARELCNEARLQKIDVGKSLLVVGIGNEPAESTFAGIGLSSFDIPAREIGFRAAKAMEALLDPECSTGSRNSTETIRAKLIARESTLSTPRARLTERARALIDESIAKA